MSINVTSFKLCSLVTVDNALEDRCKNHAQYKCINSKVWDNYAVQIINHPIPQN